MSYNKDSFVAQWLWSCKSYRSALYRWCYWTTGHWIPTAHTVAGGDSVSCSRAQQQDHCWASVLKNALVIAFKLSPTIDSSELRVGQEEKVMDQNVTFKSLLFYFLIFFPPHTSDSKIKVIYHNQNSLRKLNHTTIINPFMIRAFNFSW